MATTLEIAFVDTNVLVYAADESAVHHLKCAKLLERGLDGELTLCLSPQILAEFVSVASNPNLLPHPLSAEEARNHAEALVDAFRVVVANEGVTRRFLELLRVTGAGGKRVHDILHAATMLENGIQTVFTFDAGFTRIPGVEARTP
jgi:toxin-antitoxin system PIN domain toxin